MLELFMSKKKIIVGPEPGVEDPYVASVVALVDFLGGTPVERKTGRVGTFVGGAVILEDAVLGGYELRTTTSGARLNFGTLNTLIAANTPFTIDGYFRQTAAASNHYLFDIGSNTFYFSRSALQWRLGRAAANIIGPVNDGGASALNVNCYFCVQRDATGLISMYVGSTRLGTVQNTQTIGSATLALGNYGGGGGYNFPGFIKKWRMTSGVARHSGATITPLPYESFYIE